MHMHVAGILLHAAGLGCAGARKAGARSVAFAVSCFLKFPQHEVSKCPLLACVCVRVRAAGWGDAGYALFEILHPPH